MQTLSRILVPVDFSECSLAAVDWAALLAERFGAAIDVLHVWNAPAQPLWTPYYPLNTDERMLQFERDMAGSEMKRILARVEQSGVAVHGRLDTGDPLKTILRLADQEDYDLIVMGTHGHTGMSHRLLGGLAESVVRRSPCPVLTIRRPERAQRAETAGDERKRAQSAGAGR